MTWAITHGRGKNYFTAWTGIGPKFGGTEKTAMRFRTKREAEREILRFPFVAEVMSRVVKIAAKPRSKRS